jgi:hypothetical protein
MVHIRGREITTTVTGKTAVILCFNNRDFRNYGCPISGILKWSGTDTTIEVVYHTAYHKGTETKYQILVVVISKFSRMRIPAVCVLY